ncbi:hypothetical protein Tco_0153409 [Tanacetum coccineum]
MGSSYRKNGVGRGRKGEANSHDWGSLKRKEPTRTMSVEEVIFPLIRNKAPSVDLILIRATYQRLVAKVFESQIGRNMEAYVDDMVIKSMDEEDM